MMNFSAAGQWPLLFCAIGVSSLVACGGGGDGGTNQTPRLVSNNYHPEGTEIKQEAFEIIQMQGVWRREYNFDAVVVSQVRADNNPNVTLDKSEDVNTEMVDVIAAQYINENTGSINYCNANGFVDMDLDDQGGAIADSSEVEDDASSTSEARFYSLEEGSHYRVDFLDGNPLALQASFELNKISDLADADNDFSDAPVAFSSAELTLNDHGGGLAGLISNAACGRLVTVEKTTTFEGVSGGINSERSVISIVAPYVDSNVQLQFEFGSKVKIGTAYEIVKSKADVKKDTQVFVSILSKEYDNNDDEDHEKIIIALIGDSGTMQVDSFSKSAADGSFDFFVKMSETTTQRISGEFNVHMAM